jgi:hypothetical protein
VPTADAAPDTAELVVLGVAFEAAEQPTAVRPRATLEQELVVGILPAAVAAGFREGIRLRASALLPTVGHGRSLLSSHRSDVSWVDFPR